MFDTVNGKVSKSKYVAISSYRKKQRFLMKVKEKICPFQVLQDSIHFSASNGIEKE